MKQEFIQIAYKEGVFQFDNNAYEYGKTLGVGINPVMKIDKDNDGFLTLQLTVDYQSDDKFVMKYGGLVMYKVENLAERLEDKDFRVKIWTEAMMFFRGILCEKLKGSEIERFFLPNIPSEKVIEIPINGVPAI